MTRRDLMKFFGVGAVVAPVAVTAAPVQARILEPPKVELIELKLIESGTVMMDLFSGPLEVRVQVRSVRGGPTYELKSQGVVMEARQEPIDVTILSANPGFREFIPGPLDITMRLRDVDRQFRVVS